MSTRVNEKKMESGFEHFINERYTFTAYKTEIKVVFDFYEALWSSHELNVLLSQSTAKKIAYFLWRHVKSYVHVNVS